MNRRSNKRGNSRASTTSRRISPTILAVILGCSLAMPLLARETITITASSTQPRAADATINQASPNTNITGNPTLTVESRTGNRNQRALIEFDFSTLPNVGIKAATMTLQVTSTNATAVEPDVTYNGFLIPGSFAGPFSAQRTFPVLGTPISQRQMTGNWLVRASLDGQPIATQAVELTP